MSWRSAAALLAALAGCSNAPKDTGDTTLTTQRYHPDGWSNPADHGSAAKMQDQACTACHGADLTGGSAGVSCDSCHTAGWREDCTFCHGGTDDATGAPPRDIDGLSTDLSFPEHTAHVSAVDHPAWDCTECHSKPVDALSVGHLFVGDTTPRTAEIGFTEGLASAGYYEGAGSCANLYCHGNGAGALGAVTTGMTADCGSCHGSASAPDSLSGVHSGHLGAGATCGECHSATATGNDTISGPTEHVDGGVDVALASGMAWDGSSCSGTCHGVDHDGSSWGGGSYHPAGWDAPDAHGQAAKLQEQDCTTCHAVDLSGGTSGVSCDSCHAPDWRTDCTYCHGGTDNATGAPPVDIDGSITALSFDEHTAHVEATDHAAWDCVECHTKPADVLSFGHLFVGDATPAAAELTFAEGLSPAGHYEGAGSCSNLYCHGDGGGALGAVTTGMTADCGSCHGSASDPGTLSGVHGDHLGRGATCGECHSATATGDDTISGPTEHVDGGVDVALTSGMAWDGSSCSGTCHGVDHDGSSWGGGTYHPAGWDAPDAHGQAAKLQEQDCTTCHGADLSGGTSGVTCDSCHAPDWRTDCTYCHGGTDNATGAPPVDILGAVTSLTFDEHTSHVEATDHAAWDCVECHTKPADVLSVGHVFVGDSTPAAAELTFAEGLSPDGHYEGAGSCSNLYCHGDGGGALGAVTTGMTADCGSCHGSASDPGTLSAVHPQHLSDGAACADCHAATASGSDAIADPAQHVDGEVDVALTSGIMWDGSSCSGSCHGVEHSGSTWNESGFHPEGWDAPEEHGLAANLQLQDCTECHGADLGGGTSGESCDTCHAADWRTDCTYCHGGTDDATGAPPVDIDGSSALLSFPEHPTHVEAVNHAAWDCVQCHDTPEDVLSVGHIFVGDATPGVAELAFADGLSPDGIYDGAGSCNNLYCHGDGAAHLGDASSGGATDCASCHGSAAAPGTLSTVHSDHLANGATCGECHSTTATGDDTISGPTLHVDGAVEVSLTSGMTLSGSACSGSCHGVVHEGSTWTDASFHASGWEEVDAHGLAANLQVQTCTTCHGADLTGGTSGVGCDSCHASGWRTNCTFCHGGTDNPTGAPPADMDGSASALSFPEHTMHVEETIHPVWDCVQCHVKPADILSSGHVFVGDATPGAAELSFVAGLAPAGSYAGSGSCSNLYCHGDGASRLGSATTGAVTTCGSCHGSATSYGGMSGEHSRHLGRDIRAGCQECHATTVSSSSAVSDPTMHVNGDVDTSFPSGMSFTGGRCTGTCHAQDHDRERW